jgi:hypothetical protein
MKSRSTEKPARKAYESPKVVVYGKVSELTQTGRRRGNGGRGGGKGRGKARGHGGSRS